MSIESSTNLPVKNSSIGPHEGRELELMVAGVKPLSMFVEPVPPEFEYFPENEFDALVADGRFLKRSFMETVTGPDGNDAQFRHVLYALPQDGWRIDAVLLIHDLYDSLSPGWRPDLDRVIGILLGYEREDIENFLKFNGIADK